MASDDDQKQVERVTSRTAVEVENEIPCPEAREEVDLGETTVVEDQRSDPRSAPQSVSQPVPIVRVGGSSSSRTRSGEGSRASETNTDDRKTKRVRFTESRGEKRQGEDVEELAAKAEEQHLDADVEVSAHKTWRVEDVVTDAADAAPEQMNILHDAREQSMNSKTEVLEKIEESLRPLCSLEDDKAELRRNQNREQPELLVGSPSSDEFSSLLSTRAARETSKLKTEKIEPQIRACVQSYKLLMEMHKHFVNEHPKDSSSWEMPEIQSLINDPRVYSIDGPMCRWNLRTRGSKDKREFMRKRTRWITSSEEIAEVLRGDGRWKRDKRFVHMTGKSETVSECPASIVVAVLKAIKRQMISDGAIRIEEMYFAGPVPDEGDNPKELEGNW